MAGSGGYHDLGGVAAHPDVCLRTALTTTPERVLLQQWEREVDALYCCLTKKKKVNVDQLRRGIEAMPLGYSSDDMPYYTKWASALLVALKEGGQFSEEEVNALVLGSATEAAATGGSEQRSEPHFAKGDVVAIREEKGIESVWRRPHLRVPGYAFGAVGVVERLVGVFDNPEMLAFRHPKATKIPLYRVTIRKRELWNNSEGPDDAMREDDAVDVEVYEHWLRPASHLRDVAAAAPGKKDEDDHEPRHVLEEADVADEGAPKFGQQFAESLVKACVRKGLVSAGELRAYIDACDTFKARLLDDAVSAVKELGINAKSSTAPSVLLVLDNTEPSIHNMVVCTLCSCYPRNILGMAPSWYKSRSYRSRTVREPRLVLKEMGTAISADTCIRVHDSTADCRYIVLPKRPEGTDGWTEEQLQMLVTRDSLIGVAQCKGASQTAIRSESLPLEKT